MVDTGDLKSPGHCGRAGSSPASSTDGGILKGEGAFICEVADLNLGDKDNFDNFVCT